MNNHIINVILILIGSYFISGFLGYLLSIVFFRIMEEDEPMPFKRALLGGWWTLLLFGFFVPLVLLTKSNRD